MEFYDFKHRKKVTIADGQLEKTVIQQSGTRKVYGVTATKDGLKLFRIVSKSVWDALKVPEVKTKPKA
ncbi:MAG: hypothetical protein FJ312_10195 [SAR202 cluster bacterium]|nr:hypothetical protein [SAR202 cluster bacterium]